MILFCFASKVSRINFAAIWWFLSTPFAHRNARGKIRRGSIEVRRHSKPDSHPNSPSGIHPLPSLFFVESDTYLCTHRADRNLIAFDLLFVFVYNRC